MVLTHRFNIMKTKLIFIVLFLVLFCSCQRTLPDELLTMSRISYTGKEIRTDGCFVSDPGETKKYCTYCFFYRNGVYFHISDKLDIENIYQFTGGIDIYRNSKDNWGLFQVKVDKIEIQSWASNVVAIQYILNNRMLYVKNDTTLYEQISNTNNVRYYHFKKFGQKPDSTNVFIK